MNRKKRIMYISGSRADYGLMRETLREIQKTRGLELIIYACGMHILSRFGMTYQEIVNDKLNVKKLKATFKDDSKRSTAKFISELSAELGYWFEKEKPDMLLLLGDRVEMLSAAMIATYYGIPIAHIHGGDKSSTVDDSARHAITKLAHIHMAATRKSARRIERMGEEKKRIHIVGAPGLDRINSIRMISRKELFRRLNLDDEDTYLLLYHPESTNLKANKISMDTIISVLKETGTQTIVVYPNTDTGSSGIIESIQANSRGKKFKVFKSIRYDDFLNLMKHSEVMIGNSSSGIIEAASLNLPVINVGYRQKGRERGNNVIDVNCKREEIRKALKRAVSSGFRQRIKPNIYGDGLTYKRVSQILSQTKVNQEIFRKEMTY